MTPNGVDFSFLFCVYKVLLTVFVGLVSKLLACLMIPDKGRCTDSDLLMIVI